MDRIKQTKVKNIQVDKCHRLLFMSDIHSDYLLFSKILEEVNFCDEDYLFVIGDLYEKGPILSNIDALRYFKELSKKNNVYLMAGNCDEVLRFLNPPVDKKIFLNYALKKRNSIINDMAYLMNYTIDENIDVNDFCTKAYEKYNDLFNFIDSLDDLIIINGKLALVHGGVFDFNNIPSNSLELLKVDNFYNRIKKSSMLQIVGHYPTRNYRSDITSLNPIIDLSKNVICIDGGNQVVDGGQINLLMLDDIDKLDFYFKSYTHYPKITFNTDMNYPIPASPQSICFGNNSIEIIKEMKDFYIVKELKNNIEIYVLKENVFFFDEKAYCYDGNNLFISFRNNDKASLVKRREPYCYINYDGILGLVDTKYIDEILK